MPGEGRSQLQLIVLRFLLVCLVVGTVRLALPSQFPFTGFLAPFFTAVVILTAVYLLLWRYAAERIELVWIQLAGDLLLQSVLLFFTGGVSSLFTPFYVPIIVYSSLLRGRQGGLVALALSLVSYATLVILSYEGLVPGLESVPDPSSLLSQLGVNLLALVSVAFLGIYLSERLSSARRELGAARVVQENIIDNIRSGLCTTNLQGEITFFNRIGAEILDYPRSQLFARGIDEVLPPEIFREVTASDLMSSSRSLRLESWAATRNGTPIYLGIGCSPLLSQTDDVVGYIVSFQDLTEIKRRENEFQFREKMAAIGEMAAGLAHELRNPLASLSGSIQILSGELTLDSNQRRLLEIVLKESERLNRIVGDFLTYAGPQPVLSKRIDLVSLVQETIQLFRNSPEFDADDHSIEISATEEVACHGNPDQLRQVVWNILQNGTRAMTRGGLLTVFLASEKGRTLLKFQDQGIGMTQDQREKLFQPFHSGFRKGAGLGMAIVYQIVQQHGGSIEVVSAPGSGTTITIDLPESALTVRENSPEVASRPGS